MPRRRLFKPALVTIVAAAATCLTAGGVFFLHSYAGVRHRAADDLVRAQAATDREAYVSFQAFVGTVGESPTADAGEAAAELKRVLDDYQGLHVDDATAARLEQAVQQSADALTALRVPLSVGDLQGARDVDHSRLDPALERVRAIVAGAINTASADATRADQLAQFGSVALILLVGMGLGFMYIRGQRRRRSSDVREAQRRALLASERRFRSLVQHSSDVVTVINANGEIVEQSASVVGVFGYRVDELVGSNISTWAHPDDFKALRAHLNPDNDGSTGWLIQCRLQDSRGLWRHAELAISNLLGDPDVRGLVLNIRDISERMELERELSHRAFHDSLTGLPNRALFSDRVDHALARAVRDQHPAAVLLVDMDGFKAVNDTLGHTLGDKLLVGMSERLRGCVRPGDTVARLGADEFAILVENSAFDEATGVAERITAVLRQPFSVDGSDIFASASIGIAARESDTQTREMLMRNADAALYVAKQRGKGSHEFFESSMHGNVLSVMGLRTELRRATEMNEFVLFYQPIVDITTRAVTGFEALLRWNHPSRGMIPPLDFIPLAEETGLIVPIGRWALRDACAQLAEWREAFPQHHGLTLSVNLSARQLQDPGFAQEVSHILAETRVPASALVLEVTESVLVNEVDAVIDELNALHNLGVRIAIDDFGTGYSSLNYLRRLPRDIVKIDRSFVADAGSHAGDRGFMEAIMQLLATLDVEIVAEGIEGPEQLAYVAALGCRLAQGYYFHRPMNSEALTQVLIADPGTPVERPVAVKAPVDRPEDQAAPAAAG
jgi:diguanylate cyclase (GGDEF)-like protein/PAS domain S-box-containing protein